MLLHEEFLELCTAATVGELTAQERARLDAHLAECESCRQAMSEYELVTRLGIAALTSELAPPADLGKDSWSAESAEKVFLKRLEREETARTKSETGVTQGGEGKGQRFRHRPSEILVREVWIPFAAALILALALGITVYRRGGQKSADAAETPAQSVKESIHALEEQSSDAAHERELLLTKLNADARTIEGLKRELAEQNKTLTELKAVSPQASVSTPSAMDAKRNEQVASAQAKVARLQKELDDETARRQEVTAKATALEAEVTELTRLVRERERSLDHKQAEVSKQQELLDHDRDIRELMGARDLYVAEVHDVEGIGKTNKTYGRVFYTKGKSLIFYAYDLDTQPGLRNANTFQAWGRRGPDKEQALNLGIFYEDNTIKKRWVLKAEDPKSLADIDAVFVTVEPNGGSHHPSGKQLLFAYLQVNPNHP